MQVWAEDTNAAGGLLGKQVELVYYDDQTNPATVPAIYTKLLDVDEVDFVVSGYGTNLIAPANADRDAAGLGLPIAVRPRSQREVQLPELLPDHAGGGRSR